MNGILSFFSPSQHMGQIASHMKFQKKKYKDIFKRGITKSAMDTRTTTGGDCMQTKPTTSDDDGANNRYLMMESRPSCNCTRLASSCCVIPWWGVLMSWVARGLRYQKDKSETKSSFEPASEWCC